MLAVKPFEAVSVPLRRTDRVSVKLATVPIITATKTARCLKFIMINAIFVCGFYGELGCNNSLVIATFNVQIAENVKQQTKMTITTRVRKDDGFVCCSTFSIWSNIELEKFDQKLFNPSRGISK